MVNETAGLVSVVIPVYNAAEHLKETLESIFSQTFTNLEVVAVDDGSADDSVAILRSYGDRVVLVEQENQGPAAARNQGVKHARGEWIAFLDADDLWVPGKLEAQLASMNGCEWSYTDSIFMGGANDQKRDSELNDKPSGDVFEALICGNFIGTSSLMIKRAVFLEFDGFDQQLRSIQDWDLWMRIASRYPVAYLGEPMVKYRVHSSSTSRSTRKTLPNHLRVINKVFSLDGVGASKMHLKPLAKANSLSICSQIAEEEGDYAFAFQCAIRAFGEQPANAGRAIRAIKSAIKLVLSWFAIRR